LKVLNRRLAGPDDQARFLREGQLAASGASSPVYIFGSEEIPAPVIAMELVTGGTLRSRLIWSMTPAQAVDAVLDLAAGLDAAGRRRTHRDINRRTASSNPTGA
jgi:hypothetical protein